jgi:hypothetical protein
MSMKQAAEDLLKVADAIDKEAADVTQFVCDKCNHTATLAVVNARRKEAADAAGSNIAVSPITVNDKIQCPACEGVMAYQETEDSAPYYFDPDKEAVSKKEIDEEKGETPEEQAEEEGGKKLHKEPHASLDYDSLERYAK